MAVTTYVAKRTVVPSRAADLKVLTPPCSTGNKNSTILVLVVYIYTDLCVAVTSTLATIFYVVAKYTIVPRVELI